jgi:hypothetical protein
VFVVASEEATSTAAQVAGIAQPLQPKESSISAIIELLGMRFGG